MNIVFNAKLGDGMLYIAKSSKNAYMAFMSKDLGYLSFKMKKCLEGGFICSNISMGVSGFTGKHDIYRFTTRVSPELTVVYNMPVDDVINLLSKEDLIVWFLDDGSYHQRRNIMHLYCNSLSVECVNLLQNRIEFLYGIRPTFRWDRKKDGRQYPYLYFPRELVKKVQIDVIEFIKSNSLFSMDYKTGYSLRKESEKPPTTNEKLHKHEELSSVGYKNTRKARAL
jgi:hypothetical protein